MHPALQDVRLQSLQEPEGWPPICPGVAKRTQHKSNVGFPFLVSAHDALVNHELETF